MKFDMSCKVYNIVFSNLLKKYYKSHKCNFRLNEVIKEVKKEYKAIILRTPGLSKKNHMAPNLKGAAYFFAVAKKVPGMSPELMDDIVLVSMESDFMQKINKKKREKGLLFSEKEQRKMVADSVRSVLNSEGEMDWTYDYTMGKNECRYNISHCGVCSLAKQEHVEEYLPCMCKMDYPKYKAAGAKLIRTKTLANGDDLCDFHLVRIGSDKDKEN